MKGFAINYVFLVAIFLVVLVIGISIIRHFYTQGESKELIPEPDFNATYLCIMLNNSEIDFQDFKDILYASLTGYCTDFYATTKEKITIDDIERVVASIDKSIQVIKINECLLPTTNSGNVYVSFNEVEKNHNIYLKGRPIKISDVLICD